jgi:hypothetical protein
VEVKKNEKQKIMPHYRNCSKIHSKIVEKATIDTPNTQLYTVPEYLEIDESAGISNLQMFHN